MTKVSGREGEHPCITPSRSTGLLPASHQEHRLSQSLTLLNSTPFFQCGYTSQYTLQTAALNPIAHKTSVLPAWELTCQPDNMEFPGIHTFQAKIPQNQHNLSRSYCLTCSNPSPLHGQLHTLTPALSIPLAPAQPHPSPAELAGSHSLQTVLSCTNQMGWFPS